MSYVFVYRLCAMSRLKDGCLDSAQRLYPVLTDLQCVSIMDTVAQALQKYVEKSSHFKKILH